jgi:hypothetical protein
MEEFYCCLCLTPIVTGELVAYETPEAAVDQPLSVFYAHGLGIGMEDCNFEGPASHIASERMYEC